LDAERRVERCLALATETNERLLCVVGPTASGKTELAVALAERIGGEIVSADSVQIYRGFDIGSGKASEEEQARAPHHLIDALDPRESIDAAGYARMAEAAIADVRRRGKVPVLCGGTFFWVRALVLGLAPAPSADAEVRARHRSVAAELGPSALHAELARVDPTSAAKLHPNDLLRVSRALEIFELSGRPMSEWHEAHGWKTHRLDHVLVAPAVPPDTLSQRIEARVDTWLASGWVEEVEGLLARGYGDTRAMGSVGYKEVRAYLEGSLDRGALRDAIVQSTRIFVRRQRTWLKSAAVEWL
jgi:tRNA dimethylallyltransferase